MGLFTPTVGWFKLLGALTAKQDVCQHIGEKCKTSVRCQEIMATHKQMSVFSFLWTERRSDEPDSSGFSVGPLLVLS